MADRQDRERRYGFRDEIVGAVVDDLVGPAAGPDEELSDPPITRYAMGVLFPKDAGAADPAEAHDEAETEGDESADPAVSWSNVRYPSSFGLTFAADPTATASLRVGIEAARYRRTAGETGERPDAAAQAGGAKSCWQRAAVVVPEQPVDVRKADDGRKRRPLTDGLELFCRVREPDRHGAVSVTLVLVNTNISAKTGMRDELAFFQPRLIVDAPEATGSPFAARESSSTGVPTKTWTAIGYCIGRPQLRCRPRLQRRVGWRCAPVRKPRSARPFAPRYELLLADSNPAVESVPILALARGGRPHVIERLRAFVDGYGAWIAERKAEVDGLNESLRKTAQRHLKACDAAVSRMRSGVSLLESDDDAWTAFSLANRAMAAQMARGTWLREADGHGRPDETRAGLAAVPVGLPFAVSARRGRGRLRRTGTSPTCSGFRPAAARRKPTWASSPSPSFCVA